MGVALLGTSVLLLVAQRVGARAGERGRTLEEMRPRDAALVGACQSVSAILHGFSRSGNTSPSVSLRPLPSRGCRVLVPPLDPDDPRGAAVENLHAVRHKTGPLVDGSSSPRTSSACSWRPSSAISRSPPFSGSSFDALVAVHRLLRGSRSRARFLRRTDLLWFRRRAEGPFVVSTALKTALPPSALARRRDEFLGIVFVAAGLLLLAALVSYHPNDPSLFSAVNDQGIRPRTGRVASAPRSRTGASSSSASPRSSRRSRSLFSAGGAFCRGRSVLGGRKASVSPSSWSRLHRSRTSRSGAPARSWAGSTRAASWATSSALSRSRRSTRRAPRSSFPPAFSSACSSRPRCLSAMAFRDDAAAFGLVARVSA